MAGTAPVTRCQVPAMFSSLDRCTDRFLSAVNQDRDILPLYVALFAGRTKAGEE